MNILQLHKKTLVLLGGLSLFALLFIVLGLIQFRQKSQLQQTTPSIQLSPTITKKALITGTIFPLQQSVLEAGKKQVFTITFTSPQTMEALSPFLTVKSVTNDQDPQPTTITTQIINPTTIRITMTKTVLPDSIYLLSIINTTGNVIIFEARYTSSPPIPTPVAKNNIILSQFLPFETSTYSIEFDKDKNLYVFHFIYNSELPDDIQTQFEKAQNAAKDFIESKNIDLNSVVIQWKRY